MSDHDPTIVGRFVLHDKYGNVLQFGQWPVFIIEQKRSAGELVIYGELTLQTVKSYYVDVVSKTLAMKVPSTAVLDVAGHLSRLPNPSWVRVASENEVLVEDGTMDVDFAQPGTYLIEVRSVVQATARFEVAI